MPSRQARKPQQFTWLGYAGATGKGIVRGPDGSILTNQDVITSGSIPIGTAINMKSELVDWIPAQIEETPVVAPVEEKPDITFYFNANGQLGEYLLKAEVYTRSRRIVISTAFFIDYNSADPLIDFAIFDDMSEPGFTMLDSDTLFVYYYPSFSSYKLNTLTLSTRALVETPLSIAESATNPGFTDGPYSMCRSLDGTIFVMMGTIRIDPNAPERLQYLYRRKPDGTEEIKSFPIAQLDRFWSIASTDGNKVWAAVDYLGIVVFDFDAGTLTYPASLQPLALQAAFPDIGETTYLTLDRETGDIFVVGFERYTPAGFPSLTAAKTFTVTGSPALDQYTATVDSTADLVPGAGAISGPLAWLIREITGPTTVVAYSNFGTDITTEMSNARFKTVIYRINQETSTLERYFEYPESFQTSYLYNLPSRGGVAKRGNLYQLGFIGDYTSPGGIYYGTVSNFANATAAGLTDPPFFMAVRNNSLIPLKIRFDKRVPSNLVDDIRTNWFYFRFLEVAE